LKLALSQIDWGDAWHHYKHEIHVTVGDKHIEGTAVAVAHGRTGPVGEPLTIQKRLSDPIKISVELVCKAWVWIVGRDAAAGSAEFEGTVESLNGKTVDLPSPTHVNKATFTLSGIPEEPKLPTWGEK
jgi:hypothetical protein